MGTLDTDGASTTAIGAQTRGVVLAFHHTQTPISGEVSPAVGRTTNGMGVFVDPGMESWKEASVIPRRLTPLECERLMSWPDQWTATGRNENGTEYQLSDTARYRLCGNGVGSVCAQWIARRLHDAILRQERA